ncbi:hypothetical protein GBAR_LOCUS19465, partial [Geodia barretti]
HITLLCIGYYFVSKATRRSFPLWVEQLGTRLPSLLPPSLAGPHPPALSSRLFVLRKWLAGVRRRLF